MALNNLHVQLIKELLVAQIGKKEQTQQGSGWEWLVKEFLLKNNGGGMVPTTNAEKKVILENLADSERQLRVDSKAARPSLKTQQDTADDTAIALIDAMKTNL